MENKQDELKIMPRGAAPRSVRRGKNMIAVASGKGGVGKSLIAALKREMPSQPLIALGTNTQATAAMLKAGADQGATGENAIRYQCKSADVIVGVTGLLNANSMLGEVSPAIAMAISLSEAQKVLVPLERCGLYVAGVGQQRLDSLIREAAHLAAVLAGQAEKPEE